MVKRKKIKLCFSTKQTSVLNVIAQIRDKTAPRSWCGRRKLDPMNVGFRTGCVRAHNECSQLPEAGSLRRQNSQRCVHQTSNTLIEPKGGIEKHSCDGKLQHFLSSVFG